MAPKELMSLEEVNVVSNAIRNALVRRSLGQEAWQSVNLELIQKAQCVLLSNESEMPSSFSEGMVPSLTAVVRGIPTLS